MGRKPVLTAAESLLEGVPPLDAAAMAAVVQQMRNARVSERHYSAIGRVAASWARFEGTIDLWLWALMNVPDYIGVCLTGQMIGHGPRLDAFIALARVSGSRKKWNKKLEDFAGRAKSFADRRNRAVHDVWILKKPTNPIRREATAKRTVRLLEIQVPTQELLDRVMAIDDFESEFGQLANSIFIELASASPGKWPPEPPVSRHTSPRQDSAELAPETPPEASEGSP
jgi:hypothetical protein